MAENIPNSVVNTPPQQSTERKRFLERFGFGGKAPEDPVIARQPAASVNTPFVDGVAHPSMISPIPIPDADSLMKKAAAEATAKIAKELVDRYAVENRVMSDSKNSSGQSNVSPIPESVTGIAGSLEVAPLAEGPLVEASDTQPPNKSFFDSFNKSPNGQSKPGFATTSIQLPVAEVVPPPTLPQQSESAPVVSPTFEEKGNVALVPVSKLQEKAQELSKKADAELTRQLNTPHLIPEYSNGAMASREPALASTTEEKENIAPIAVTPEPTEERFTVPIDAKPFPNAVDVGLLKRCMQIDAERKEKGNEASKAFQKRLIESYKNNELLGKINAASQLSVPESAASISGESPVVPIDGTLTKVVAGEVKESARVGGLRRLFSRGGRSILATLVITAGLGQLKPGSAAIPQGAIPAALQSQDVSLSHDRLGNSLTFPPRSIVTAQAETSVMAIPGLTESTDHAASASVVTSLHPSTPDTLPLSVISSTPDSSSSQPVVQATQPASSETLTHPSEMNHNHVMKVERSHGRFGRVTQHVNRILHRGSSTREQAPQTPEETAIARLEEQPLKVDNTFEAAVKDELSKLPEANNFDGKADLLAQVAFVLGKARNGDTYSVVTKGAAFTWQSVLGPDDSPEALAFKAALAAPTRTYYGSNVLPGIIKIMQNGKR